MNKYQKRKITTPEFVDGCHAEVSSSSSSKSSELVNKVATMQKKTYSNKSRGVKRALATDSTLLEPYEADIILWDRHSAKQVVRPMCFLNIHEVVETVVEENPGVDFCRYDDRQPRYEEVLSDTCQRLGVDRQHTGGIAIWGDYAKYHTRDSIALLLWSFLTGPIRQRFWLAGFAKRQGCNCGCSQKHTIDGMFQVVKWMLQVMLARTWPSVRHDGIPFKDSHRPGDAERARMAGKPLPFMLVIQKKCADWSWFKGTMGLQGWANGVGKSIAKTCFKCMADCDGVPWTDPSKTAKWRPTVFTTATFWAFAMFTNMHVSPIFGWPGFLYDMVDADWMHTVDLGVTLSALGNMCLDFFEHVGGTRTNCDPALGKLMNMIIVASHAVGKKPPIWDLTLSMIQSGADAPLLKLKAAEARYMVPVCLHMARHFFPATSDYEKLRLQMFEQLAHCYKQLDDFNAESMGFHARSFVMMYNQLNRDALSTNIRSLRWRLYPKFHLMIHLCESGENPKDSWNYMDESAIGDSAIDAEGCHPNHMHRALIQNRRIFHHRRK